MEIEHIKITDLKPAEYNPRRISDDDYQKLKNSISTFGLVDPIIVNLKNMHIVGGHQRYDVLLDEHMLDNDFVAELPMVRLGDVGFVFTDTNLSIEDDAHEKALNLALNKISGEWDEQKLQPLLEELELSPIDIQLTGFSEPELEELNIDTTEETGEGVVEDEYVEPEELETDIKHGDLFRLGNHYLCCGDATIEEDVERLLSASGERESIDLLLTDPPYGMKKENEGILNDNQNQEELLEFNQKWFNILFPYLSEVGSAYVFGIDEILMDIYSNILKPLIKENKITFRNLITWDKGNGQGQLSPEFRMYPIADEKILFFMMGVQGFNTNADNYFEGWEPVRQYLLQSRLAMGWDVPTMKRIVGHSDLSSDHWTSKSQFSLIPEYAYKKLQEEAEKQRQSSNQNDAFKKEYDAIKKEYYDTRAYFNNTHDNMNNVWHFNRPTQAEREHCGNHASPKPLKLCERIILTSSRENEKVVDIFGGSGSTLITCEQTNRNCYMMELSPHYCQVIINRWETFTGQKAEKIN